MLNVLDFDTGQITGHIYLNEDAEIDYFNEDLVVFTVGDNRFFQTYNLDTCQKISQYVTLNDASNEYDPDDYYLDEDEEDFE